MKLPTQGPDDKSPQIVVDQKAKAEASSPPASATASKYYLLSPPKVEGDWRPHVEVVSADAFLDPDAAYTMRLIAPDSAKLTK